MIRNDIDRVGGIATGVNKARSATRSRRCSYMSRWRDWFRSRSKVEEVRSGVAGAAVELEGGDLAGNVRT